MGNGKEKIKEMALNGLMLLDDLAMIGASATGAMVIAPQIQMEMQAVLSDQNLFDQPTKSILREPKKEPTAGNGKNPFIEKAVGANHQLLSTRPQSYPLRR